MHIAVLRFSALGDVAMTVPVIHSLACAHTDVRVTVVSRPFMAPLFAQMPANVSFKSADLKGRHKGPAGMMRLARELQSAGVTHVADLHDVLRTKLLRMRLRLAGCDVSVIDKGRPDKRRLVARGAIHTAALPHAVERYRETFRRSGLQFPLIQPRFSFSRSPFQEDGKIWIGLAPFAAHATKIYPFGMLCEAVAHVRRKRPEIRLFIFSSQAEAEMLQSDEPEMLHGATYCASSCGGLAEELAVMSRLSCMVAMDSGNAHLASLTGTKVLSLWGATHPYAGFSPWGQSEDYCLQAELPCRPCSIFGEKPCRYGDMRCMKALPPQAVAEKILQILPQ